MATTLILFVCGNNRRRSPLAAAYFQRRLQEFGLDRIHTESAGLRTRRQDMIDRGAVDALAKIGLEPLQLGVRQLSPKQANSASLILCMTSDQATELEKKIPSAARKVRTLLSIVDSDGQVFDPRENDLGGHARCLDLMRPALDALVERLR
jgi:protein-tyrosine-phosphatase